VGKHETYSRLRREKTSQNKLRDKLLLAAGAALLMCMSSSAQVLKGSISGQVLVPQGTVRLGPRSKPPKSPRMSRGTTIAMNLATSGLAWCPSVNTKSRLRQKTSRLTHYATQMKRTPRDQAATHHQRRLVLKRVSGSICVLRQYQSHGKGWEEPWLLSGLA
jgi:hypothetical protein